MTLPDDTAMSDQHGSCDEIPSSEHGSDVPLAHAGMLEDHLPERWRVTLAVPLLTSVLAVIFILLSYLPLWHTDLWGHLSYGRWIATTGHIPVTEPLMPLSTGMPFVDTEWLSQWIGYQSYQLYSVAAIQALFAAGITGCLVLFVWRCYRKTEHVVWTLAGMSVLIALNWMQWSIARPQIAGQVCFALLWLMLTSRHRTRWQLVTIPVLFAAWANLHGAFIVGLSCLAACVVGRAFDLLRRTKTSATIWKDTSFRHDLLLLELAATAVLLNPYGVQLYREVLSFSATSNLSDLVEWQPLTLRMRQGKIFVTVALALIAVLRFSPRRISTSEILILIGLGCGTMWSSRFIVWWAPWAAWFFALHGHAAWNARRSRKRVESVRETKGMWTVASIGLIWISLAIAPLGGAIMHGRIPEQQKAVSQFTPLGAVKYLHENPPRGQIFNTYEWGDYLLWAGPENLQVFVASHAHLVPVEVWQAYMHIVELGSGWDEQLERYGVNTVVIDHRYREALINVMKNSDKWELKLDDGTAVIFERKVPI
ncbi:MAG: hypothetical protein O2955_03340 [Planctomycetota bacterium]|nr:hypothetical protein [Planctomycetota bacterium]